MALHAWIYIQKLSLRTHGGICFLGVERAWEAKLGDRTDDMIPNGSVQVEDKCMPYCAIA